MWKGFFNAVNIFLYQTISFTFPLVGNGQQQLKQQVVKRFVFIFLIANLQNSLLNITEKNDGSLIFL